MKKIVRLIFMTIISLLVVSAGQFSHVYAMQDESSMVMQKDGAMSSMTYEQHCQMSCTSTAAKKEDLLYHIKKDEDKDTNPQPPYYVQFSSTDIIRSSRELEQYVIPDPHMKIPLYQLYAVVRR